MTYKLIKKSVTLAIATVAIPCSASAAVTILNPGFEAPNHTANNGTNPNDWTVVESNIGGNTDRQVRTRNTNARTGNLSLQLGAGNSNHDGELYQTVTTEINQEYTFSIWARKLNLTTNQNIAIDLLQGTGITGLSLASIDTGGDLTEEYLEYTVNFTATSTDTTIWIRDVSTSASSDGNDIFLDDVSIVEVVSVPEPSSTALLGLGALTLILRRRK